VFNIPRICDNCKSKVVFKTWNGIGINSETNKTIIPMQNMIIDEEIAIFCEDDLNEVQEIAVFYEKQCLYNPQMVEGKENHSIGKVEGEDICKNNNNYGDFGRVNTKGNLKYPRQLMYYQRPHPPIHPTEKPIGLLEDLILTYTNKGDSILYFTAGSITLGRAAENLGRKWTCIEMNEKYCELGKSRF